MNAENKTNDLTKGQIAEMQKTNLGRYNYLKKRISASKKITCARLIELFEDENVVKKFEMPNENIGSKYKADRKNMEFDTDKGKVKVGYWKMRLTLGDVVVESGDVINASKEYSMYRIKSKEERKEYKLALTLTEEKGNYVKFMRLFSNFAIAEIKKNHEEYGIKAFESKMKRPKWNLNKPYKTHKIDKETEEEVELKHTLSSVNFKFYNKTDYINVAKFDQDEVESNPMKTFIEYKTDGDIKKAVVKTRTSRFFVEEAYHRTKEEVDAIQKEYKKKGISLIGKNGKSKQFRNGKKDVTHLCMETNIHNYFPRSGILGMSFYMPTITFSALGVSFRPDFAMIMYKADPEQEYVAEADSEDDEFDDFVVDTAKPKVKEEPLPENDEYEEEKFQDREEQNSNNIEVDEKEKSNTEATLNHFDNMTTVDADDVEDIICLE